MRHILIALLLGFSISGFSQSYKISNLVLIGDSIVNSTIGSSYLDYYKLDTSSYYKYYNWIKKEKKQQIIGQNTKGKFKEISLRYKISYPEIVELSSTLYILIDNTLKVEKFTSDIPDFILENKPCTFIKRGKVVTIGDSLLKEKGLHIEYFLNRDYVTHRFVWKIQNIIKEPVKGRFVDGLMETIDINPYNGDIIEQKVVPYGYVF